MRAQSSLSSRNGLVITYARISSAKVMPGKRQSNKMQFAGPGIFSIPIACCHFARDSSSLISNDIVAAGDKILHIRVHLFDILRVAVTEELIFLRYIIIKIAASFSVRCVIVL